MLPAAAVHRQVHALWCSSFFAVPSTHYDFYFAYLVSTLGGNEYIKSNSPW